MSDPKKAMMVIQQMPMEQITKAILDGDLARELVQQLPVQLLHLAWHARGHESLPTLCSLITISQYQLLLDLELWQRDSVDDQKLWEWLLAIDERNSLQPMLKLIEAIDPHILALLISRHVGVIILEEASDTPPAEGAYTPDKGFTWLYLKEVTGDQTFLLGRLLALLYEHKRELFYQILALPQFSTPVEIEEEAYQGRRRRLLDQEIPDYEMAAEVHARKRIGEVRATLERDEPRPEMKLEQALPPALIRPDDIRPLATLVYELCLPGREGDREQFEMELTYVTNAALIFCSTPVAETDQVRQLISQVRGAVNIGLELVLQEEDCTPYRAWHALGAKTLYQLGFGMLQDLRKFALRFPDVVLQEETETGEIPEEAARVELAATQELFPRRVIFEQEGSGLRPCYEAFSHLSELSVAQERLKERFGH